MILYEIWEKNEKVAMWECKTKWNGCFIYRM